MFRTVWFSVALLWAGSAAAADQPVYGPPSAWVRPVPIPKNVAATDTTPVQVLLADGQTNFGPTEDELYTERAQKILTPQGLNSFGVLSESWDPDTETLVIHRLDIIRGGTVINALADGKKFMVLRRENNLELAMLDGRLTATIQPEGLQVGDIVDLAYTIHRHDPALQGMSTDVDRLVHVGIAGRVHYRAIWADSKPMRWRATDGIPTPQVNRAGAGEELVIDLRDVETPKPPRGAPSRFYDLGSLELSQYADWAELSRRMTPLYAKAATLGPKSPLAAEIARIAAASADPKVRATMALRLVEDQTRYVFLGMNDGGLVPADADATWSRRFGDCKGKTVLLIALLQGLGVDAKPALVSTTFGDGMDQRLPASWWFDHVIVRAQIAGKTYWLDGTRVGDRDLDDLVVPPFRWALPLQTAGAGLEALEPVPLAEPSMEERLTIDATKGPGATAPAHIEVLYRGEEAARQRQVQAGQSRSDYERYLHEFWTKAYPWLDVQSVTMPDVQAGGLPRLTADGVARMDWIASSDGSRFYRVPATALGADISFKREPGPHQDAPYGVNYPLYVKTTRQISLPPDGSYLLVGADVDKTLAGMALHRAARIENGVLTVEMSTRAVEREFPATEAEADAATLRELATTGVSVVYQNAGAGAGPRAARTEGLPADRVAADRGDAAAQYRLSEAYRQGRGVPFDPASAIAWLRKAAEQGYPKAEGALGTVYLGGSGVPRDLATAVSWLRKGADHGDPLAQSNLAAVYTDGAGVARDDAQAILLANKAASQGYPGGEYLLAMLYLQGRGVPADPALALTWMRKAADQGLASAQIQLGFSYAVGRGTGVDYIQAAAWFRKAADQGDSAAGLALGSLYLHGYGVPQDYAQALSWFQKASDRGSAQAKLSIAGLYFEGLGVPKDMAKSYEWVRKAADQGFPEAENELGSAYETGVGMPRDYAQAIIWLSKAAAQGNPRAQNTLGYMYGKGEGVPRDTALELQWYQKSAAQNHPRAQHNLGLLYFNGEGVDRDYHEAEAWFRKAADKHFPDSQYMLGKMYTEGIGVVQDRGQGLKWYQLAADQGYARAQTALIAANKYRVPTPADAAETLIAVRKAAEQGDAGAQAQLAHSYTKGVGVGVDYSQALIWAEKSAAQGNMLGESQLGAMYMDGRGVPRDPAKAAVILRKAADQGLSNAQVNLGTLYDHGLGVPQDFAQALAWYRKAADQGNDAGETNVGIMYWEGRGVPRDFLQALVWLRKGAQKGNVYAERFLGLAYLNGLGVSVDKIQAENWFTRSAAHGDLFSQQQLAFLHKNGPPPGLTPPG